ncbi:hypothetical protein XaFJ1_GM000453 [Xanthomonas albilineans]|nr:hypothetical protein XaFJ1_GM000453 [Xanthomonas albilineans]
MAGWSAWIDARVGDDVQVAAKRFWSNTSDFSAAHARDPAL